MASKKRTTQKKTAKEKVLKPGKETAVEKRTPSYVNLVYGAVTVVVLFLLAFFAIKAFTNHNLGEITEESATDQATAETYTVKEGDTLWSIAEAELGSGYQWREILNANQIKDPTNLEAGTELKIPEKTKVSTNTAQVSSPSATTAPTDSISPTVEVTTSPTAQPQPTISQKPTITGTEYVVKPGDTLWDIAVNAYGDGYKWVEIAQKNNLSNPDLIFSGNKLTLR